MILISNDENEHISIDDNDKAGIWGYCYDYNELYYYHYHHHYHYYYH